MQLYELDIELHIDVISSRMECVFEAKMVSVVQIGGPAKKVTVSPSEAIYFSQLQYASDNNKKDSMY